MMKHNFSRQKYIFMAALVAVSVALGGFGGRASAAYDAQNLMSDSIMRNYSSMTAGEIQTFLAGKNSGLKNYYDTEQCGSSSGSHYTFNTTYYSCGQSVLASKIIWDAAQAYGINPQAIMATLQKEQSLITTANPSTSQLNCAMGYLSCAPSVLGFFEQVADGAWQLRTNMDLMSGTSWWGLSPSNYACKNPTSLFSTGLYPGRTVTFYNFGGTPYKTITLANAATAALYCYTPHVGPYSETGFSGSYNFVVNFELWFGSVYGDQIGSSAYRLWTNSTRDHYYTAKEGDRAFAKQKAGFKEDGVAFSVGATQLPGMVPVYSQYNGRMNDHWLSIDGMAHYWALVIGGYRDDGIAFYAYPPNPNEAGTACAQGIPVYSLWHGGNTDHFMTTSNGDRFWGLIHGGYIDDRSAPYNDYFGYVAFCVPA